MTSKKLLRLIAMLMALALFGAACSSGGDSAAPATDEPSAEATAEAAAATSDTGAAALRAGLTTLLQEHVYLASLATGSALRGDTAGFEAYAAALNGPSNSNTADLTAAITSAYGAQVGTAFDGLWRSDGHIPAVVAYTQAVAKNDATGAAQAVAALTAYADTFGTTLNSVNDNLGATAVADGVKEHIGTLKAVIDAQKSGNMSGLYSSLREAYGHMAAFAAVLADATAQKFPEKFAGDANSAPSEYRALLTRLLGEHVWLFSSATAARLAGRTAEFDAAVATLNGSGDSNTTDVVNAVKFAYGQGIGSAFDGLWRSEKHIPAIFKYVDAIKAGDAALAEKSFQEEAEYALTFGKVIGDVNPFLPEPDVAGVVLEHVTTLRKVIDAQATNDPVLTASELRIAAHHMDGISDFVANGTVKACVEGLLRECQIVDAA
ncbi:MAG: hypothetical protein ACT4OM_03155 [Actinomycetota bacterium]